MSECSKERESEPNAEDARHVDEIFADADFRLVLEHLDRIFEHEGDVHLATVVLVILQHPGGVRNHVAVRKWEFLLTNLKHANTLLARYVAQVLVVMLVLETLRNLMISRLNAWGRIVAATRSESTNVVNGVCSTVAKAISRIFLEDDSLDIVVRLDLLGMDEKPNLADISGLQSEVRLKFNSEEGVEEVVQLHSIEGVDSTCVEQLHMKALALSTVHEEIDDVLNIKFLQVLLRGAEFGFNQVAWMGVPNFLDQVSELHRHSLNFLVTHIFQRVTAFCVQVSFGHRAIGKLTSLSDVVWKLVAFDDIGDWEAEAEGWRINQVGPLDHRRHVKLVAKEHHAHHIALVEESDETDSDPYPMDDTMTKSWLNRNHS